MQRTVSLVGLCVVSFVAGGIATRLYDLHDDPHETVDLTAKDPARAAKLRDLLRQGSYRPT